MHMVIFIELSLRVQKESAFLHLLSQFKSLKLYAGVAKKEAPGAVVH